MTLDGDVCHAPGEGLFGVAPGQSAVFYGEKDEILCGGIIAQETSKSLRHFNLDAEEAAG